MFEIIDNHVSVDVADLEATRSYLEESCGLNKLREVNRPGLTIAWYPGLELWQATDDAAPGIVKHVAWQVDDIDAAVVDLKAKGVTFDTEEIQQIDVDVVDTGEIVRYIFFTTPVGLQGELYEVNPPRD